MFTNIFPMASCEISSIGSVNVKLTLFYVNTVHIYLLLSCSVIVTHNASVLYFQLTLFPVTCLASFDDFHLYNRFCSSTVVDQVVVDRPTFHLPSGETVNAVILSKCPI